MESSDPSTWFELCFSLVPFLKVWNSVFYSAVALAHQKLPSFSATCADIHYCVCSVDGLPGDCIYFR